MNLCGRTLRKFAIAGGALTGCTALKYLHLGPGITDVSEGQIYIGDTQLGHILHIWFDYKGGVITAPAYMDAQKDSVVYHVDYSLLKDYMKADTWKDFIFERTLDDASEVQFTNAQAKLMGMSFDGVTTGIDEVRLDSDTLAALQGNSSAQAPAYNLAGQRVDNGYKGIVIVNGKKLLRK